MQLTLDHINEPGTSIINIYEKWALLDFLDRKCSQTGLMIYEEDTYRFRIPFQIGEFNFSLMPKQLSGHQLRLTHWSSKYSSLYMKHRLTSLLETQDGFKAFYSQDVGRGKELKTIENIAGKTHFYLRNYPLGATRFPNIESSLNEYDVFKALKGATVHLKVRLHQDWVQELASIPFAVEYIGVQENVISIFGSNDTELTIKGFKGIRTNETQGYIHFDIYDNVNGYSRSFQIMSRIRS